MTSNLGKKARVIGVGFPYPGMVVTVVEDVFAEGEFSRITVEGKYAPCLRKSFSRSGKEIVVAGYAPDGLTLLVKDLDDENFQRTWDAPFRNLEDIEDLISGLSELTVKDFKFSADGRALFAKLPLGGKYFNIRISATEKSHGEG